ncbi:MAG: hypothetical protein EZS28_051232, partial [Streblomastix strix]
MDFHYRTDKPGNEHIILTGK